MKIKKTLFWLLSFMLMAVFSLAVSSSVKAETYNFENYTIVEEDGYLSVTDNETGLSAYLDREGGTITDIDGSVSYIPVAPLTIPNNYFEPGHVAMFRSVSIPGLKSGVWNHISTNSYNLGYMQSVQSVIVGFLALIPSPASFPLGVISSSLGVASLVNGNVTVRITQYYDPAQPSKIREDITTYKNGRRVGFSSTVRNIF